MDDAGDFALEVGLEGQHCPAVPHGYVALLPVLPVLAVYEVLLGSLVELAVGHGYALLNGNQLLYAVLFYLAVGSYVLGYLVPQVYEFLKIPQERDCLEALQGIEELLEHSRCLEECMDLSQLHRLQYRAWFCCQNCIIFYIRE